MNVNNQNKKVSFEPKLLIFEGTEVAQQERRSLPQQQQLAQSDFYQGMQDVVFPMTNNIPIDNQADLLEMVNIGADKDISSYTNSQFYQQGMQQQQQQFQQGLVKGLSSQGFQVSPGANYGQKINQGAELKNDRAASIKQSKSMNDMTSNNQVGFQQQNQLASSSARQIPKNESGNSLSKQQNQGSSTNMPISSIKGNVKNTYIKKISSLMSVHHSKEDLRNEGGDKSGNVKEETRESDDDLDDSSKSVENKPGDDPNDHKRLKKNRESARNSRQRKKIYIELLEKKVSEMNANIEEVCVYIEKSQQGISEILEHNPFTHGLVKDRQSFIEKIQNCLQEPKPNEDDLNLICDSFRLRLGATGKIRQHTIGLFFKHLYKAFFENNYLYFLYGYDSNQDYEDEEFNRCVEIFKDAVGLPENDNQIYSALPILKKFLEHRKSFKKTFLEMKNLQKEWKEKAASVENLVDKISPLLTATQVGKLIDNIDKKRQQPELSTMKKKFNQGVNLQIPNNLLNTTSNHPFIMNNNNYSSSLTQPLMTPSQILQASSALGNNFAYHGNSISQNNLQNIKPSASFQNGPLDFNQDNNNLGGGPNSVTNIGSEDQAQNFYTQLQFQNYRMYPQVFQLHQPSYFGNQGQNVDMAQLGQPGNSLPSHIPGQPQHSLSMTQMQSGENPLQHQFQVQQQARLHEHMFQNVPLNSGQNLPFFDLLPQQKEELKQQQNTGIIGGGSDAYYIEDPTQKKRKQY